MGMTKSFSVAQKKTKALEVIDSEQPLEKVDTGIESEQVEIQWFNEMKKKSGSISRQNNSDRKDGWNNSIQLQGPATPKEDAKRKKKHVNEIKSRQKTVNEFSKS